MEKPTRDSEPAGPPVRRYFWWLIGGCAVVLLVAMLWPRRPALRADASGAASITATGSSSSSGRVAPAHPFARRSSSPAAHPADGLTAEEIVTNKVVQFARNRRKLMHDMAGRLKVKVPPKLDEFFTTAESGKWEDIEAAFKSLAAYKTNLIEAAEKNRDAAGKFGPEDEAWALANLWPSVTEMHGVAEAAHTWPAQRLLDYGNAILDSLRPGTVYLGGTDAGRYIPTLLNETSEGERHVVLTQNAFADGTYLEYTRALYGDRLATLTAEDSQRGFQEYMADAQKRMKHDQEFPNEPKQLRPGENVRVDNNRMQISGQVAVMAINDRLVQILMEKNPGVPFAIEQGFPLNSTYAGATPLGPIMELGSPNQPSAITAERATQAVDYWRNAAQQLNADTTANDSLAIRNAYAKMASEQGALLLARDHAPAAEQAFRIATEISPGQADAVSGYVKYLGERGRFDEAIQVLENALKAAPDNKQFREGAERLRNRKKP